MIYEYPGLAERIRQGDIFRSIPSFDVNLDELPVADGDGFYKKEWLKANERGEPVTTLVAMKPTTAIVITQDCDAVRIDDIALCEILSFSDVYSVAKTARYPKGTMSVITTHSRTNLAWFYLPIEARIGFTYKMAVDFHHVLTTSRKYLEQHLELRLARLNQTATDHFRERLSEYFRRYPYNEWYPLDKQEFDEYQKNKKDEPIEPYPYQK